MRFKTEQEQIFYILKNIDYSKDLKDIEYALGYTLGDHRFENSDTYDIVKQAVRNLWVVLHNHLNSEGNS